MRNKILTLSLLVIFFFGCKKEEENIEPNINENNQTLINSIKDLNVNKDFDFNSTKTIKLNVKLPSSLNSNKTYVVNVYDNEDLNLLAKGSTNENGEYSTNIKLSTASNNIIIKTIAGTYEVEISNNIAELDYNNIYSDDSTNTNLKNIYKSANNKFTKEKSINSNNLITNGDFSTNDFSVGNETNAKNNLNKWYIMNENDFTHYNNNSVRYYNNGYTVSAELYQGFNVSANSDLTVSVDIKTSGFNNWSALRLAFYDDAGNSVGYQQVSVYPYSVWNTYTISATVPSSATKAVFYPIVIFSFPFAEVVIDNVFASTLNETDTDGDGIIDKEDAFPDDNTKAFYVSFPSNSIGTYAFEDLWPYTGDYDFNDLVLNYKYNYVTDARNLLVSLECNYKIKAVGGSFKNGFGFSLNKPSSVISSITGTYNTESYINYNSNGTEAGQTNAVIIVFDNVFDVIPHPGGIGINTTHENTYVIPVDVNIKLNMTNPLDISDFTINPFIIINGDRSYEVHLPNYLPTDLANTNLFGQGQDNSLYVGYYKSELNLPWALSVPVDFDYPIEKVDITQAHLKFANWVQSNGTQYTDWYEDKSGYRNSNNIY